jgi:hypothetical protein
MSIVGYSHVDVAPGPLHGTLCPLGCCDHLLTAAVRASARLLQALILIP